MHFFTRNILIVFGIILSISIDLAECCSNQTASSTNATYPGYAALAQDCINLADSFALQWYNHPQNLTYTHANGVVHFPPNGTCDFQLQVSPASDPVHIDFYSISILISDVLEKYTMNIDGEAQVGGVGTWDCRDNHAQAVWYVMRYRS